MKLRYHALAIATLAIAGSAIIQAQPPAGGGRRPGPPDLTALKSYLNLTDAQVTSLGDLNKAQRDSTRTLSEDLRSKHQAMNTALRSGASDPASVTAAAQAIQAGEQKMQAIHQQYQSQAVGLLTSDQQAKLKVLSDAAALGEQIHQAAMMGLITPPAGPGGGGPAMFRRGPGGPGGPQPPPED